MHSCNQAKCIRVIKLNSFVYSSQNNLWLWAIQLGGDGTHKEVAPREGCHHIRNHEDGAIVST